VFVWVYEIHCTGLPKWALALFNSRPKWWTPIFSQVQARRQDLAAGGGQNQKEEPETRRGCHIFLIQYWMYVATGGQMWNGGNRCQMGGRAPLATRWRRPCPSTAETSFLQFFNQAKATFGSNEAWSRVVSLLWTSSKYVRVSLTLCHHIPGQICRIVFKLKPTLPFHVERKNVKHRQKEKRTKIVALCVTPEHDQVSLFLSF